MSHLSKALSPPPPPTHYLAATTIRTFWTLWAYGSIFKTLGLHSSNYFFLIYKHIFYVVLSVYLSKSDYY